MSVFIIAEAGVNHNGSLKLAKELADKAKAAGADCIKFQTFVSKNLVAKGADKAEYQKFHTGAEENQLSMLQKLELSFQEFIELNDYCKFIDIKFLSTAFDIESMDFLRSLDMDAWKIPSGEITNLPYLMKVGSLGKKVIMSTGMANMEEIEKAVSILRREGTSDITLLHCTTEYPAPYAEVNLKVIQTMREAFDLRVGYSDHTLGIEVPIAAVALGAEVIEKHFTLDKNMEGPDHKASLEPDELGNMVRAIRNIELAMGTGDKKPTESELRNMSVARKSIIAGRRIKKGEVFTEENLAVKRPGTGISPMCWFEVLGQTAIKDFDEDELIVL